MPLDLNAIKQRWQGVEWQFQEQPAPGGMIAGLIASSDVHVARMYPTPEQCNLLCLAAQAPRDIQALIAEVERLRAALDMKEPQVGDQLTCQVCGKPIVYGWRHLGEARHDALL